jgi:hypothetical protein
MVGMLLLWVTLLVRKSLVYLVVALPDGARLVRLAGAGGSATAGVGASLWPHLLDRNA